MIQIKGNNNSYYINSNECFWDMLCRKGESRKIPSDSIQNTHGVYVFWDWEDNPIRIGKAVKVRNRIMQYESDYKFQLWSKDIQFVSAIYTNSNIESAIIEDELIKIYQPNHNVHSK